MLWACAKMLFYYYIYLILHVDSFFWKMSGVSAFQWFQETVHYLSHFTALHYQAWLSPSQNLNRSAFRLFGICVFFCGIIAEMFFFGSFHRFSRRLQIAHLNPQTLRKNTLDIQVFFETKSFRTLRCLMSRCIGFREKAGQHREHPRTPGFFWLFRIWNLQVYSIGWLTHYPTTISTPTLGKTLPRLRRIELRNSCRWAQQRGTLCSQGLKKSHAKTCTGWWLSHPSEKYESQLGW